jgi:hypothetical protein
LLNNTNMKIYKYIFPVLIFTMLSCNDFLTEQPYSIVAPNSFFKTKSDFNGAVVGAYTLLMTPQLYSWYYPNTLVGLTYETRIPTTFGEYTLGIDASYTYTQTTWTGFYAVINQCNLTLKKLSVAEIDEDAKNVLKGELLFLRGMVYFDLNRLYGGVPLHLKPSETIEDLSLPRSSIEDCYKQIILDLQEAENLLPLVNPFEKGRACKGSAAGLLAKVYLTMAGKPLEDVTKMQFAYDKLIEVIDTTDTSKSKQPYNYHLETDYQNLFIVSTARVIAVVSKYAVENGPESVFEINFKGLTDGTPGAIFPHAGSFNGRAAGTWIYNMYDNVDYRKDVAFCKTGDPYGAKATQRKFPRTGSLWNNHENNWYYLRYADLVLMLAEVENELNGPTNLALNAINAIRKRARNAGGTSVTTPADYTIVKASSKEALRALIYKERELELAVEGQTWFDWQRTGRIKEMVETQNVAGRVYKQAIELFPIPIQEITLSKGVLTQNTGY